MDIMFKKCKMVSFPGARIPAKAGTPINHKEVVTALPRCAPQNSTMRR